MNGQKHDSDSNKESILAFFGEIKRLESCLRPSLLGKLQVVSRDSGVVAGVVSFFRANHYLTLQNSRFVRSLTTDKKLTNYLNMILSSCFLVTSQNSTATRSDISQSGGNIGPSRSSKSIRCRFSQLYRESTSDTKILLANYKGYFRKGTFVTNQIVCCVHDKGDTSLFTIQAVSFVSGPDVQERHLLTCAV